MDGERFDRWARALAAGLDRRRVVAVAVAASIGVAGVGRRATADVSAVCRNPGVRCRSSAQCCSLDCSARRCLCAPLGDSCRSSAGCCTGFCHHVDSRRAFCSCRVRGETCSSARTCCSGTCSFDGRCACSRLGQPCRVFGNCCGALRCRGGQCVP